MELPWCILCGVGAFAGIVLGEALFEIGAEADVVAIGIFDATKNVGVEHFA